MQDPKTRKISTGSFDINKWLYGGYEPGIVTMIAGPPGSGKTNMCILAACSQARRNNKVIYFDTEAGFSIDRVKQIVEETEYENVLGNIILLNPTSFEEQKKASLKLLEQIKKEKISLLIIDSIAMLYRLELAEASRDDNTSRNGNENGKGSEKAKGVNREMAGQMRLLSEIARKLDIPVLITNQVYSEFISKEDFEKGAEKKVNIVGGDLMKYWSKCIIELKNDNGRRKALLLKHRSLPQMEMAFEIRRKGIYKKGWI